MSKYKSQDKYDAENTTKIGIKLNQKTEKDIIDWISKQGQKQTAIKELIREEIEAEEKSMVKIVAFREEDARVDFEVNGSAYHTDKNGEGLWENDDYTKQVAGTLDFSLKQKTRSGARRAIEKYFKMA